jgi:hypothetical protein
MRIEAKQAVEMLGVGGDAESEMEFATALMYRFPSETANQRARMEIRTRPRNWCHLRWARKTMVQEE